jgi:outer membrane protein insertion porin family
MVTVQKSNLFGKGWDIGGLVQGQLHNFTFRKVEAHFLDPHIFDSNVSSGFYFYKRWDEYDQWTTLNKTPRQRVTGGNLQLGFWLPKIDKRLQLMLELGVEDIKNNMPQARGMSQERENLELIVKRSFKEGTLSWLGLELTKDTRDHQVYPRSGYKICIGAKTTLPGINHQFSFFKGEVEASYYTALIEKFIMGDSLVLGLHGKLGNVQGYAYNRPIPYKELFHIGGQSTVRGFVWGGIGPAWKNGDPLGARNAIVWNVELVFPLIPDYSMKAHVFYDAGAGFDTPKDDIKNLAWIKRDSFDLRHSVGFGLNLVKPVPAKIDWGFKLDRKKNQHESPHEFHLSMNHAW